MFPKLVAHSPSFFSMCRLSQRWFSYNHHKVGKLGGKISLGPLGSFGRKVSTSYPLATKFSDTNPILSKAILSKNPILSNRVLSKPILSSPILSSPILSKPLLWKPNYEGKQNLYQ